MFTRYVEEALKKARYEVMEDGDYFASIPGFDGVWGTGKTVEECREDLLGSLEGWLILGLWMNDPDIPKLGKLDLVPRRGRTPRKNGSSLTPRARKAS